MQESPRQLLLNLGLCSESSIVPFFPRVRDRDDITVFHDTRSGVIFLSSSSHIDTAHYEDLSAGEYWQASSCSEGAMHYSEDDWRRIKQFEDDIRGKDFVDVGCGTGAVLERFKTIAQSVAGVELQKNVRESLVQSGISMFRTASQLPSDAYDIATLFHVLEHFTDPIGELIEVRRALRKGGKLIVEVPHARDALLELDVFKSFSLWSEHLILHTRESLSRFLVEAGFSKIEVHGFQRYPLANHIGWLVNGKPGGQKTLPQFTETPLAEEYQNLLKRADKTDTLIATAQASL